MSTPRPRFLPRLASLSFATLLLVVFQNCAKFEPGNFKEESSTVSPERAWDGKMVDVFMASGHVGRTIMSCDDGQTWINDRSDNPATRCWVTGDPNYLECDHTPMSGVGIDSDDGWFFTNFGWGYPGSIRRSRDGVQWETVRTNGWGGGVAFTKGILFSIWNRWDTSSDLGQTWSAVANSPYAQLGHPVVKRLGERLIVYGRTGGIRLSDDGGMTWAAPVTFSDEWASGFFAESKTTMVSLGYRQTTDGTNTYLGYIARSTDGGMNWTGEQVYSIPGRPWQGLVFNGSEFMAYLGKEVWHSPDAQTWTKTPIAVTGAAWGNGPIGFNPTKGTYIALVNSGSTYYTDKQVALRSKDGVNWTKASFPPGHPMKDITLGKMESRYCP